MEIEREKLYDIVHNAIEHVYDTLDEFEETQDNAAPLFDATVELIQALVRVGLADKDYQARKRDGNVPFFVSIKK